MADQKITELVAITDAAGDEIVYIVDDPGGTPVSNKITVTNFLKTVLALSGGTMTGAIDMANQNINEAVFVDYGEAGEIDEASGTTKSLDIAAEGNNFNIKLDNNCTFTFDNPSIAGTFCSITVVLRQDLAGNRLVTWPAPVIWPDGSEPTISTAANAMDAFTFFTWDGGVTWLGNLVGLNYS